MMRGRSAGPEGGAGRRRERRPVRGTRGLALAVTLVCLAMWGAAATAQLSGQLGLDFVARRIPTTLSDEIALDTPSEFAMLEFAIASNLDVKVGCGFADILLDLGTNMAGPEHGVGIVDARIAPIDLGDVSVENIHAIAELWFAVPFEGVTDVNNLPNCVVIPPGNPLFVTARFTTSFDCAGFSARVLFMLQDVTFPNPSAEYAPLYYEHADQDVGLGSIWNVSWSSAIGLHFRLTAGINASPAPTVVKGYSASWRVDSGECTPEWGNCFLNGGVTGIPLCDLSLGFVDITDVTMGLSFSVSTTQELSAMLSVSGKAFGGLSIGTSLSLTSGPPATSGLLLSGSVGCFEFGFLLDKLELKSLSAGCTTPIQLGPITGSFDLSATGLHAGLTGISARLSLSQGLFSAGTSVTFAQLGTQFGFASLGTQLAFRFSPGTITVQATFGRFGLTRASISTGVSF